MLNIITPCSRLQNLAIIEQSINIPRDQFRWIIIFDKPTIPECYIPNIAESYCHQESDSVVGHAQRNFALNLIDNGHIYFNDDDTTLHPDLWTNIKDYLNYDFISFDQDNKYHQKRLIGSNIRVNHIDSHNFIVDMNICKHIRFIVNKYNADGYFATACYKEAKNPIYIAKTLSIYNSLR